MSASDNNGGGKKKVIVIRLAAFGDAIIVTPLFKLLKRDGYHVTFHTSKWGMEVTKHNPYIDRWSLHDASIPPDERLAEYFTKLSEGYDKTINLCESIEGTLAKVPWREDFKQSKEILHEQCNKNFYDYTLELAGYPDKGLNGELYFSRIEECLAAEIRRKYRGKFLILWSLSGSSLHKSYPYSEYVAKGLLEKYDDIQIITVGDSICGMIEWTHPRTKNYSGVWNIRKSLIMAKYADCVVGPDTGLLHAAGCYDVPKVLLLSSNTEENLSKYWKNCTNLTPSVDCHPCHKLHYDMKHCPKDEIIGTPICMSKLKAKDVFEAIEKIYLKQRHERKVA